MEITKRSMGTTDYTMGIHPELQLRSTQQRNKEKVIIPRNVILQACRLEDANMTMTSSPDIHQGGRHHGASEVSRYAYVYRLFRKI